MLVSDTGFFEILFSGMAAGTCPVGRDIFPGRTRVNAIVRHSRLLIVDPATDKTQPCTHFFSPVAVDYR